MTALWQQVREEVQSQFAAIRPFVGYAGAVSAGKIKLRRIIEATAGEELYGMVLPFVPAVNDESVWIMVGDKPVLLGKHGRVAGPALYTGAGTPEGAVTAAIGSVYLRSDGGSGTIIYEKATGSGNTGWVANSAAATPAPVNTVPMALPFPLGIDFVLGTTSLISNSSYAYYIGRAGSAFTSVSIRVQVDTALVTTTWAEVGIGTSPDITLNGGASITRRGFTNVASVFSSTGDKTVAITVSDVAEGDNLWALIGSQATTQAQFASCESDVVAPGVSQFVAATRISTMASPTSFAATSGTGALSVFGFAIGS